MKTVFLSWKKDQPNSWQTPPNLKWKKCTRYNFIKFWNTKHEEKNPKNFPREKKYDCSKTNDHWISINILSTTQDTKAALKLEFYIKCNYK